MRGSISVGTAIRLAMVVVLVGSQHFVATADAQSPSDVPWAQVPDDLRAAIKAQAEAYGKPSNLSYSGSCEAGIAGQLCARVLTLDATESRVGIGLFRSEATFFDFAKTSSGWTIAPAAPATGTGGTTSDSHLFLPVMAIGSALLGLAAVAVLWQRRQER
ncbi:hypothetical protein EDM76_09760 [bacterium]|nr:MAG: hypothetical protein EDM76_09760 [bacterium]